MDNFVTSCSTSSKDRNAIIKNVLAEIRKEKPLGKCPLFKMSLTFRSFVWAPLIDSIYGSHSSQKLERSIQPEVLIKKKPLLRSHSTTSVKSLEILKNPSVSEVTEGNIAPAKTARNHAMRLNMLTTVPSTTVSVKTPNKNLSQQADLSTQRSHKIGAVPKYLTHRKAEWARIEEEKLKNLPDPDCPEGHIRMPDSEKLETLANLKKTQQELLEEFNQLPLSKDSLRIRQKKEDIEKQLIKVEEGIRVLSKPKVFVRFDC